MPRLQMIRVLALVFAAALASGCATTQATANLPEAPALDPPPPPPRVIAPLDLEETAPASAGVPDGSSRAGQPPRPGARPASPAARETPAAGRGGEPPKTEAPKPDPEPVKPAEAAVEAPAPVHRLQPLNEAEQERLIREHIAAAERDLSRVDYRRLGAPVRNQYDTAKRLVAQAKDALKSRNFVFADSLAEKAAAIAASLKKP